MRIQILQHSLDDPPALVKTWADGRGHDTKVTHIYKGEIPDDPAKFDFLVILGGDMNVHEENEHPWLRSEKKFIEAVLKAEKNTLGICLGGQLIAEVLGAKVKQNPHPEIGWFPVKMLEPSQFTKTWPTKIDFMHWHEYTFEIPKGAKRVAESEACANQAYVYGENVFATQFHPEVDIPWVQHTLRPPHPEAGRFVQTADEIRAKLSTIAENKSLFFTLLDTLSRA